MEIYIITTGSYSARDIDKVFTDATKAKEYMELLYKRGTTDADLNIWDTSDNEKSFIQYMVAYQFPIKTVPAGNCGRVRTIREGSPVLTQLPGGATVTSTLSKPSLTYTLNDSGEEFVTGYAYGKDYKQAEKNLWDAIAQFKAENTEL